MPGLLPKARQARPHPPNDNVELIRIVRRESLLVQICVMRRGRRSIPLPVAGLAEMTTSLAAVARRV